MGAGQSLSISYYSRIHDYSCTIPIRGNTERILYGVQETRNLPSSK